LRRQSFSSRSGTRPLKPSREKSTDRIDGIAAWCDALFARHVAGEPRDEVSAYETVRTILT